MGWAVVSMVLCLASPALAGDLIHRDAPSPRVASPSAQAGAGRGERVRVDASVLAADPDSLWLELAPGEGWWAYRSDVERRTPTDLVWRGRFAADDAGYVSVTLTLLGDDVVGTMEPPGGPTYRLLPGRDGGWELRHDDGPDLGCGVGGPSSPDLAASAGESPAAGRERVVAAAARREVSMLVVFTPRAADWLGRGRLDALSRHNVDRFNTILRNSGVDGSARLAAVEVVDLGIDRAKANEALLDLIVEPRVHELEERWQADVVSAVLSSREASGVCGIANALVKSWYGPQFAGKAYDIVVDGCFEYGRAFAHEAGHLLGAMHDPAHVGAPGVAIFPYAFAHGVDGHFRTIMSYPGACEDCDEVEVFSNPLRSIGGVATGIENRRDNARTLNATFPFVAGLRTGKPQPPPVPKPAAPSGLTAVALSPTEVALAWNDNAGDETGFEIEALAGDGAAGWQRVAELPADATAHTVGDLEPATAYRFRVRATGAGKPSAYSNEAAATTPQALPAAPAGLTAVPRSASSVRLRWEAVDGATGYEVERRGADPAADVAAAPIQHATDGTAVDGLAAATPYTFRVRAVNGEGASPWSAAASATTLGAGGPCLADGATLCLLGGRFEVRAQWRNPRSPFGHGAGMAQAAAGSERTGLFSFFNPDNVELVVKMLDGRPVNGAFWSFYGALSDVEYWVSVRDAETAGAVRTYHNEPFALCGLGDTTAFVDGPEGPAAATAGPSRSRPRTRPTRSLSRPPRSPEPDPPRSPEPVEGRGDRLPAGSGHAVPGRRPLPGRGRVGQPADRHPGRRPRLRRPRQRRHRPLLVLPRGQPRAGGEGARRAADQRPLLDLLGRPVRRRLHDPRHRHHERRGPRLRQRSLHPVRRCRHRPAVGAGCSTIAPSWHGRRAAPKRRPRRPRPRVPPAATYRRPGTRARPRCAAAASSTPPCRGSSAPTRRCCACSSSSALWSPSSGC